jgi:hypothetical protein
LYKWNKKKYAFQLLGGIYQADIVLGGVVGLEALKRLDLKEK